LIEQNGAKILKPEKILKHSEWQLMTNTIKSLRNKRGQRNAKPSRRHYWLTIYPQSNYLIIADSSKARDYEYRLIHFMEQCP
jgi:hypothetical protein